MGGKNKIEVFIGGKVYTILGEESEGYMQKVARYIDKKMMDISNTQRSTVLSTTMLCVLTSINVADDYFKLKIENEQLLEEIKNNSNKFNDNIKKIEVYEQELVILKNENSMLKEKINFQCDFSDNNGNGEELMLYEHELGKLQDENIALKEKLSEVIVELANAKEELNDYIENFDSNDKRT